MGLAELKNWMATKDALHQAAQVIGAARRELAEPRPNWVHLGLQVDEKGVATELAAGKLSLDFEGGTIAFRSGEQTNTLLVDGQTQAALVDALEALLEDSGHSVSLNRDKLHGEGVLSIDSGLGRDYAQILSWAWERLRTVRNDLAGYQTELVLWPHGFDAAFLWFAAADAANEEKDLHVGVGFSPGSPGLDRPYFFAYVWPQPDGLTDHALPASARWQTEGWTGAVIDYDDIRGMANPDDVLENTLHGVLGVLGQGIVSQL